MMKKRFEYLLIFLGLFIICLNFISAAAPTFIAPLPANTSIFYGNGSVSSNIFNATNTSAFGNYSINDSRFLITQIGFITNNQTAILTNATPMTNFAAGVYLINVTINNSVAASNSSVIYIVQVNKSNYGNDCAVYFNVASPITYPNSTFITYTNCSSNYTLYMNGTTIGNATTINSGASYYNMTVQRTDTTNYTNTVMSQFFTINKNPEKFNVLFNASSGINYPDTFLTWANSTTSFVLFRNGTTIGNNTEQGGLAAGTYNFSAQRTDTANYTYTYNDTFFVLNKNQEKCQVLFNLSSPQVFPKVFTVWANCTNSFVLERNGTVITNNSAQINLAVSAYNFSLFRSDTQNFTYYYNDSQYRITPDAVAPTYAENKSASSTEVGSTTLFAINVNDNAALDSNGSYIFSTNNTGTWVNDSAMFFTTTPSWANVTKTLNKTLGARVDYRWFFNDTSNNLDSTPIYTLTTTADTVSPTYSDSAIESSYAGRANAFTITVDDNIALETNGQYIFSTDNNGTWINDTAVNFATTSEIARSVKTLNSTVGKVVSYRWFFSDNAGNTNSTPIYSLTTIYFPGSAGGSSATTGGSSPSSTTYTADEQFSSPSGDEYSMKVADKVSFAVSGSPSHSLTVKSFTSESANVQIMSTPIVATLQKGVLYGFDITGDAVNDINVRYNGLVGGKASIFMQEIVPVVVPPVTTPVETPAETTPTDTTTNTPSDNTNTTTNTSSSKLNMSILVIAIVAVIIILLVIILKRAKHHKKKKYYSMY